MTKQSSTDTKPIPCIESEEDISFEDIVENEETIMPKREQESLERMREKRNNYETSKKWELKANAYRLICVFASALLIMYVLDTVIINCNLESSSLTTSLFELIKFVLSSLIGYLFCIKSTE